MGAEGSLDYESEIVVQLGRLTITVRNPDRETRRRSPPPPSAEAAEPSTGSADADDLLLCQGLSRALPREPRRRPSWLQALPVAWVHWV